MTTMHEIARTTQGTDGKTMHHVPFFNPDNERSQQVSHLRLINSGHRDVEVAIAGRDDAGGGCQRRDADRAARQYSVLAEREST